MGGTGCTQLWGGTVCRPRVPMARPRPGARTAWPWTQKARGPRGCPSPAPALVPWQAFLLGTFWKPLGQAQYVAVGD